MGKLRAKRVLTKDCWDFAREYSATKYRLLPNPPSTHANKGKEKISGERKNVYLLIQKYSDGEMLGFVRDGTVHHEIKGLIRLQVLQTSYN